MKENLIIIHGGGPTAVLNCSLYGAIREAQASGAVEHVYGAVGGTGGLLKEKLLDFNTVPEAQLELLPTTPATAIGTSRDALEAEDYARMTEILEEHNIRYVLMNGGNGTMDACGKLAAACKDKGIKVMGIPKTMDNDIAVTDHCPGFGSVARYMAGTVRELGVDVRSLPIHVVVLESLGRNAGWTTAASALAREQGGDAPHLIYPPERAFHEDEFLDRVGDMYRRLGGVVVVASEGLHDDEGKPIVPPIFQTGRSTYFGDVSSHLAQMIVRRLGIKARSEKPGILARASIAWQSPVDAAEAECLPSLIGARPSSFPSRRSCWASGCSRPSISAPTAPTLRRSSAAGAHRCWDPSCRPWPDWSEPNSILNAADLLIGRVFAYGRKKYDKTSYLPKPESLSILDTTKGG